MDIMENKLREYKVSWMIPPNSLKGELTERHLLSFLSLVLIVKNISDITE